MPSATCELKVRLDEDLAAKVRSVADGIGMSSSAVAKVLLKRFADEGGFPFAVRAPLQPDYAKVPRAKVVDGVLVMPASWRDEDDEDE